MLSLGSSTAVAQSLEWLGPSGAVSPEGFRVALLKRSPRGEPMALSAPAVEAVGATLRAAPPEPPLQTFLVVPDAGAKEVRLTARDGKLSATSTYSLGPPAAQVELSLEPTAPVKGRDTAAVLRVRVRTADGRPDADSAPPVVVTNVGEVEALERVGPGEFRARYVLPPTRYPEVAVLVAFSAWPHPQSIYGAFGSLRVPLASAIELPGQTERNAKMSIEIAGERYGPVQAGPDGRFRLPVVVPPGHRFGVGTAVDRHGNARRSKVDLRLPPTDQLACVHNPRELPADGVSRARVICALSDPYGKPVSRARVRVDAQHGEVKGPRQVGEGLLEWLYSAPRRLAPSDTLTATWREAGPLSREVRAMALVQGPVASVSLSGPDEPLLRGGRAVLVVEAKDALGRPRPGASLSFRASEGTFGEAREVAPGKWEVPYLPAVDGGYGAAAVAVRALGPRGERPARLVAAVEGGSLKVAVTDLAGLPVARQRVLRFDEQGCAPCERVTGEDGLADGGAVAPGTLTLRHSQWPGLRSTVFVLPGGRVFPPNPLPTSPSAELSVALAPSTPVNLRFEVAGARVTYWAEDASGAVLSSRTLRLESDGVTVTPSHAQRGRHTVSVAGRGSIAVTDLDTGVTAVLELSP